MILGPTSSLISSRNQGRAPAIRCQVASLFLFLPSLASGSSSDLSSSLKPQAWVGRCRDLSLKPQGISRGQPAVHRAAGFQTVSRTAHLRAAPLLHRCRARTSLRILPWHAPPLRGWGLLPCTSSALTPMLSLPASFSLFLGLGLAGRGASGILHSQSLETGGFPSSDRGRYSGGCNVSMALDKGQLLGEGAPAMTGDGGGRARIPTRLRG